MRGEFRTYVIPAIFVRSEARACVVFAIVLAVVVLFGRFGREPHSVQLLRSSVELLASGEEATIVVEQVRAKDIGNQLVEKRPVGSASDFTKRVNELGVDAQLKPGTSTFAGGTSLDDIIKQLAAGPDMGNALTIPEGYKLSDIAAAVATASRLPHHGRGFLATAQFNASVYAGSYNFLADAARIPSRAFCSPKTYAVTDDATAESLVRRCSTSSRRKRRAWTGRIRSPGAFIHDAVNLASIVEKESSGDPQIRAQVAAVSQSLRNAEWVTAASYRATPRPSMNLARIRPSRCTPRRLTARTRTRVCRPHPSARPP